MTASDIGHKAIDARPFSKYAKDPVGFIRDVLGEAGRPYDKQIEILQAVIGNRRVTVVGCNGSGKDWTTARIVLWWVETRAKAKAIVTGPTQRQVEDVVWREMRMAYATAEGRLSGKMYPSRYVIDDERFALGFSTNHADNLQGFHSPNMLSVVTEAHGVAQDHVDALKRLNPKLLLLTGNALQLSGEFYDSHHGKSKLYTRIAISAFDTPNVKERRDDAMPGMMTLADVEERLLEWGEKNPLYVASVLGQFPEALEDSLVSRVLVDQAIERWKDSAPESGKPWVMGVDVARFGSDKTVLCLRRGGRVEEVIEMWGIDTMQISGKVIEQVRRHGIRSVYVDGIGIGAGVVDRLRELNQPVVDVKAGAASTNPEMFVNLRAELFWELRKRFMNGEIAIPDDPGLTGQLLGLKYDVDSAGKTKMESKALLRKKGLPSPDKADAMAMAFMASQETVSIWI